MQVARVRGFPWQSRQGGGARACLGLTLLVSAGCATYQSATVTGAVGLRLGDMRDVASTSVEMCWLGQLATPTVECDVAERDAALWVQALDAILRYSRQLVVVGGEQSLDGPAVNAAAASLVATDDAVTANAALRALDDALNGLARDQELRDFVRNAAPHADKLARLLQDHVAIQVEQLEAADAQLKFQLLDPDDLRCTVDDEPVRLCVNNNAVDNYAYVEARMDVRRRLRAHRDALAALGRFRRAHRVFVSEFLASSFDDAATSEHIRATLAVDEVAVSTKDER